MCCSTLVLHYVCCVALSSQSTCTPVWNEAFMFAIPNDKGQARDLIVRLMDNDWLGGYERSYAVVDLFSLPLASGPKREVVELKSHGKYPLGQVVCVTHD